MRGIRILLVLAITFSHTSVVLSQAETLDSLKNVFLDDMKPEDEKYKIFKNYKDQFELKKDTLGVIQMKIYMAESLVRLGFEKIALKVIVEANQLLELKDDPESSIMLHFLLGKIYRYRNDFELSRKHMELTRRLQEELVENGEADSSDYLNLIISYTQLGVTYDWKGDFDSSRYYYLKAMDLAREKNFPKQEAKLYSELAYAMSDKPDSALANVNKALDYFRPLKDEPYLADLYNNMAYIAIKKNDFNLAELYLDSAYKIASDLKNSRAVSTNLMMHAELKFEQKKYEESKKLWLSNFAYKDSTRDANSWKNLQELEVLFELEQKEKTIAQKESELLLKNQQEQLQSFILYGILGSILLLVVIFVFILTRMKTNIKKRKEINEINKKLLREQIKSKDQESIILKNEVELKKKKLTDVATDLSRNYQFAEYILENLKAVKKAKDKGQLINDLIVYTKGHQDINDNLKVLWDNVDNVNYEFFNKLENNYPQLSKSDIRLCGLIQLNLSDKEISTIKRVNPDSILQAKRRLRKKLNLEGAANLKEFLSNV